MLAAAGEVARLALADYFSRSNSLDDRHRAVRIIAAPFTYDRLADKAEDLGLDPVPALTQAVALDPSDPDRHMRLALRLELAGNLPAAEAHLLAAAHLSRLYQPRFLLAQYYFRRQNADQFFRWSKSAFAIAYGDVTPLLDLCWRVRPAPEWLRQQIVPARHEVLRQYLTFLTRLHQSEAATAVADEIARTPAASDSAVLLAFCENSLSSGDASPAVRIWNRLVNTRLIAAAELQPDKGVSLADARFQNNVSGQAFDWHLSDTAGVITRRGIGLLKIDFTGHQHEWCPIAWQYLAVVKDARYRLRLDLAGIDGADPIGIAPKVYTLADDELPTEPRPDGFVAFRAAATVLRLYISYLRPQGYPRLTGSVAVREVHLEFDR